MENNFLTSFEMLSDKKKWQKPSIEILGKSIIEVGDDPAWPEGVTTTPASFLFGSGS